MTEVDNDGKPQKKNWVTSSTRKIFLQQPRVQTLPCYCQEIIFSRIKNLHECICGGQREFDF